jgi:hypothetical protein
MIFYDFETFKYDWMVCYLDTDTREEGCIINDRDGFKEFYEKYKYTIWVGYNSRGFDQWIAKGILAGFDPYKITKWIIDEGRKGWEFSKLLGKFPILNYDAQVGFRSLKELEAFLGHDIRETDVPFDLDRPLTKEELESTKQYCMYDVKETFHIFVETAGQFETLYGLIQEFNLPLTMISKTETQLTAYILGAVRKDYKDEHDIQFTDKVKLDKYKFVKEWFEERAKNLTDFTDDLETEISGIPTKFAWGGVHGAKPSYFGEGFFVLSDVNLMYTSMMLEFDLLSRSAKFKDKVREIYDTRFKLKAEGNPRQERYKLVLNKTYGGSLDKYNPLYDPRNGRSVCVNGQLALTMLLERVEHMVESVNINTDGILVKLHSKDDFPEYKRICDEWERETGLGLGHDIITNVWQKDVNNAIFLHDNGKIKSIGAYVKPLNKLDYHLPIVNKAIKEYFINGIEPYETIMKENRMIEFQFITKVSTKYEYAIYKGKPLTNKVYRVFATLGDGGTLYKQHKEKEIGSIDKTAGTPENCVIINEDITEMETPHWLDRQWYIDLAEKRIKDFLGE